MFSTLQEVEQFFKQRQLLGMKPGLERIRELLHRSGNPERRMKAIHIAGTNGKGSTLHYLKNALQANGYKVGVFTSPSFQGIRGHILLDDDPIAASDFVHIFNELYPHIKEMDEQDFAPTEFEIITAMAFRFFAEHGEIMLIEAGMGGRFDTTNSFQPVMSIITNIALDHTQYLGETTKEIAFHKAGIIKQYTPVIIGEMDPEANAVIMEIAGTEQSTVYSFGKDFHYVKSGGQYVWKYEGKEFPFHLEMMGEHQLHNASLALMALSVLETKGYSVDWQNALSAMEHTNIPGRFEVVHRDPLIIIDAAHNPDGIKAFLETVTSHYSNSDKHLIVAMFRDKAVNEMLQLLCNEFENVTWTTFEHPRAWDPYALESRYPNHDIQPDYKQMLETIVQKQGDTVYFITGSLHFISAVRNYLMREK